MSELLGMDTATVVKGLGTGLLAILLAVLPAVLTARARRAGGNEEGETPGHDSAGRRWDEVIERYSRLVDQAQEDRESAYRQIQAQDVRHARQVLDLENARERDRAEHAAAMRELRAEVDRVVTLSRRAEQRLTDYSDLLRRQLREAGIEPHPWPEERAP